MRRPLLLALALALAVAVVLPAQAQTPPEPDPDEPRATASGFLFYKLPTPQPLCSGVAFNVTSAPYYIRHEDCGFSNFTVAGAPEGAAVTVALTGEGQEEPFATPEVTDRGAGEYRFQIRPDAAWPAGEITATVMVDGHDAGIGYFFHNALGAIVQSVAKDDGSAYRPGEDVPLTGEVFALDATTNSEEREGVPATFTLVVSAPGIEAATLGEVTAEDDGSFTAMLPGSLTGEMTADETTNFRVVASVEALDATYEDATRGTFARARAGGGPVTLQTPIDVLLLENSFTSAVGWVKPGEEYPFRLIVRNFTDEAHSGVTVTVPAVDGTTYTEARPVGGAGTANITDGVLTWLVGDVPAGSGDEPAVRSIVVTAAADDLADDPEVVWKDLSTTATLTYDGGGAVVERSHGPKVIPPSSTYETARYGDRPFPVVPVDFRDRKHQDEHSGAQLSFVINDPDNEGSTFNLYQEMSYGQIYPNGSVPSAGIQTATFEYEPGFDFTQNAETPPTTCQGVTVPEAAGTPLLPERIVDGFYQLPGDTGYYGSDSGGTALSPAASQIDAGCGETGKAVYDAATIADPEIDYNEFDTDKDGLVDFFMMVFVGCGGNGASQLAPALCPYDDVPYDNIWPHSSTLEGGYFDEETGLTGYISDDRLTDLEGNLLFYTDAGYTQLTTDETEFPAYVRVGPYNVNPETAIDRASVISHEYGHSLGLPDYYSGAGATGTTNFYGTWNLMAADYSQHMDVQARQEMGWVIPRVLEDGRSTIEGMVEAKVDTHRIDWQTIDGEPYTLEGPDVHNGEAYAAALPRSLLIEPALVENGASPTHVWWSGSGNDFNCPPNEGHNLDVDLSILEQVEPGTPITLELSSYWEIEWDYDYGFTMVTTDNGESYTSLPSEEGYTTPATQNPYGSACQARFGNGLTGSSESYDQGTQELDRAQGIVREGDNFLRDRYDLSDFAGEDVFLRFSYATDVGLAEPGWFIDDLVVRAGQDVLYETDFEDSGDPADPTIYNGACQEDLSSGPSCTEGWSYVSSAEGAPVDHAYYFELRDRTGFDLDANDQSDRGPITWAPGLSLAFTNEALGYGNSSRQDRPNQHIIDSQPQPGVIAPNLDDAAWTATEGDDVYSDFGEGHVDNYKDEEDEEGFLRFAFDCLSFEVLSMSGAEEGPEAPPGDLEADVSVTTGPGCEPYDYGYSGVEVGDPDVPGRPPVDPVDPTDPTDPGLDEVSRVAGAGRIETAIELSQVGFDSADQVVLARADAFPDALTSATLAAEVGGPVLLTDSSRVHPAVAEELDRLGAETVYLAGGEAALAADVAAQVEADGRTVRRLGGANRYETARLIAEEVVGLGGAVENAIVARADDFADALAASNLATFGRSPILLTDTTELHPTTAAALDDLLPQGSLVTIAGGTAAVAESTEDAIEDAGHRVRRRAGANRFETAVALVQAALGEGASVEPTFLASGGNFPDALAAGPVAHERGGVLLLVDPTALDRSPATAEFLSANAEAIDTLIVVGGEEAVAPSVQDAAFAAIGDAS